MSGRSLFTISPDRPFADVLAEGLLRRAEGQPLVLAQMRVLLPSRRAIRALREAFLRASAGKPLLLPNMQAIGDVDEEELLLGMAEQAEIPPAIAPSRRILLLATLIWQFQKTAYGNRPPFEQAVQLAAELAKFLDDVQREECDFADLEGLVSGELAQHWQITVNFLQILIREWPNILIQEGRIDPVQRRNLMLGWLVNHWTLNPPSDPVIAAGTTGSTPATARLLDVVSGLPQGMVILPALDTAMAEKEWELLDEAHPQWGMAQLLAGMESPREAVREFDGDEATDSPRVALLKTALRPAEATDLWRGETLDWAAGIAGCHRLDCATIQHEATTIALLLRDVLDTPGKTAALITPNRELARRVAAVLRRFHVEIDDSAGTPLSRTSGGVFLQLVVDMVAAQAAPIQLLAMLKHPFALLGLPVGEAHKLARRLERYTLRGVRMTNALSGIAKDIVSNDKIKQKEALLLFVERIAKIVAPLEGIFTANDAPLAVLLKTHVAVAEALSTDEAGDCRLWQGEDGEALLAFVHEIAASSERLGNKETGGALPARSYPAVLGTMLKGRAWRPKFGTHPRLHILSPMESRLQRFDRVVLAGLNEGSWPSDVGQDPWLSRPMRRDFRLPQPEERIGLSAHDFYVLASAGEVFVTRAEKEGGAASVPSRWLLRLEAVLGAQGGAAAKKAWTQQGRDWMAWAATLDAAETVEPQAEPQPKPPLEARPRSLSVTRVERLLQNPYGLYASHILNLHKLDPIDKEPGNAEFGNFVHAALEAYMHQPERSVEALLGCGRNVLDPLMSRPAVAALWWPRFVHIAEWVIKADAEYPHAIDRTEMEQEISMQWEAPGGRFTLKSRVDRVDDLSIGKTRLIDYKTGEPFKLKSDLERGLVCQLLLGGAIAMDNGKPLEDLQYWALKGGNAESRVESLAKIAEESKALGIPLAEWVQKVLEDVKAVIAGYDDPQKPYLHCPVAEDAPAYNDYEHLARPQEWGGDA